MSPDRMPLRIGVVCFSTFGGSGVVAAEVAIALAAAATRCTCSATSGPARLVRGRWPRLFFHQVAAPAYPQLEPPPYALALTSKIVEVSRRERLDVVHAHYALPHAVSANLARQILRRRRRARAPRVVTTLHGTDITLVGSDPSFLPLDALLHREQRRGHRALRAGSPRRRARRSTSRRGRDRRRPELRRRRAFRARARRRPPAPRTAGVVHVSNFRPLKRVDDVVAVFARVRAARPARLRLIGDGPERARVEGAARGAGSRGDVEFSASGSTCPRARRRRLFLLPSETESFGLAALEAMACGVPVVASESAACPRSIGDGEAGFLCPVGDVDAMAAARAACSTTRASPPHGRRRAPRAPRPLPPEPAIARYLEVYRRVVGA